VKDPLKITRNGKQIDLEGLWSPNPGFLVCGGPSLQDFDLNRLRERGVVSLGVNLAAAWAPVRAWCFSDSHFKFHHGLWLDPAVMTFAPIPKIANKRRLFHVKLDGEFRDAIPTMCCPNTYGYHRRTRFVPSQFFETEYAHWGPRGDQPENEKEQGCLCTMLIGLRLLYYLGCRRIYLLGVDHRGRNGTCYGFPNEKKERNRRYRWETHMLERLTPRLEEKGVELFNCSERSACRLYPYVPFDEAIIDCKGSVPEEPWDTTDWYRLDKHTKDCKKNPQFIPVHYERVI